jgi:transcriptional regulator with XRE-family HTH domain
LATIEQIRAARALLGWSQKDLADRAGLSQTGIARLENGSHKPTTQTLDKILDAFNDSGIEFIQDGLIRRDDSIRTITGDNCYLRLLEDVEKTFSACDGKKELLIWCADDRESPPAVNDAYRALRRAGVKMRQLVAEGNDWLMGPLEEYRALPKNFFVNVVKLSYGDKFATINSAGTRIIIHKDSEAAESHRDIFELLWTLLPRPERSVANERF